VQVLVDGTWLDGSPKWTIKYIEHPRPDYCICSHDYAGAALRPSRDSPFSVHMKG